MEEIKVGEYVRTDCGTIIKVKKIEEDEETKDIWYYEGFCLGAWKSRVTKHSPNIIDLIEVGDYVNDYKIFRIDVINDGKVFKIYKYGSTECLRMWKNKDIKSIVTKEQFESMKYEVK